MVSQTVNKTVEKMDAVQMKVTAKQPMRFYIRSALSFLKGNGEEKPPTEKLTISALGNAINVAIACASRVEKSGLGNVDQVKTDYVTMVESGGKSVPHIEILISRSADADQIAAAELKDLLDDSKTEATAE